MLVSFPRGWSAIAEKFEIEPRWDIRRASLIFWGSLTSMLRGHVSYFKRPNDECI